MRRPCTADLDLAALWLDSNEGTEETENDPDGERAVCRRVSAWLRELVAEAESRQNTSQAIREYAAQNNTTPGKVRKMLAANRKREA